MNQLPDLEENTFKQTRIVDDEYFKLDFLQMGKNYQYELDEKSSTFITVIKGMDYLTIIIKHSICIQNKHFIPMEMKT